MTPSKEILDDIENWSAAKLKQWFLDSMARYEMMDMTEQDATAYTMMTLVTMSAMMMALTRLTPEESGEKIVEAIKIVRKARNKKCAPPKA